MKVIVEHDTFLTREGGVTNDEGEAVMLLARAGRPIPPALIKRHNLADKLDPFIQSKREKGAPLNKAEFPAETKEDEEEVPNEPEGEDERKELGKLSRADLDELASAEGLDPKDYKTKADVIDALS